MVIYIRVTGLAILWSLNVLFVATAATFEGFWGSTCWPGRVCTEVGILTCCPGGIVGGVSFILIHCWAKLAQSTRRCKFVLNIIFTTWVLPCMYTLFICHVFIHSGIHIHPLISISHVCCWWIRPHNHHKHDWIKTIFL